MTPDGTIALFQRGEALGRIKMPDPGSGLEKPKILEKRRTRCLIGMLILFLVLWMDHSKNDPKAQFSSRVVAKR